LPRLTTKYHLMYRIGEKKVCNAHPAPNIHLEKVRELTLAKGDGI